MSSNPRRPSNWLSASSVRPALVITTLTALALMAQGSQLAGVAAGQYVLSGSPNGTGRFIVDDKLEIFLNGQPIYTDAVVGRGYRQPITFTADIGDQLRFVVNDTTLPLSGGCPGLSTIYLVDPQGKSAVATPGFYIDCPDPPGGPEGGTAPGPGQGLVFDTTFTIPDIAVTGSSYKEKDLLGSAFAGPLLLNGALYGVTYDGGNGGGTIYRASPDLSQLTTLYSFPGNGQHGQPGVPYAELTPGGKGFFGTTDMSTNGGGTIFEFDISTNTISYLVDMSDFSYSLDSPLLLIGDYLYAGSRSRIFRIHTNGTGLEVLRTLDDSEGRNAGALTLGPDGYLYGTAIFGGSFTCDPNFGCGTVFRLRPDGQDFSVLHVFNKTPVNGDVFADKYPQRRLVLGYDNRLYGTTYRGVFSLAPGQAPADFKFIYSLNNLDGSQIFAPPAEGPDGRIYVAQYDGGIEVLGAVYSMTKSGTNVVMHHQFAANGQAYLPYGQLSVDSAGTIYGTTEYSDTTSSTGRLFAIRTGTGSNQPPIANASAPASVVAGANCEASVQLNGSGSSDPEGGALTYRWSENGVQIATGPTPTVQLGIGTHTIRLTVTDPANATDFDEVTVAVTSATTVSYVGPNLLQSQGSNILQASVTGPNGPIAGADITFTVNGTPFPTTSDGAGIASVNVGAIAGAAAIITIDYPAAACGGATQTVTKSVNRWPTVTPTAPSPVFAGPNCTASVALAANAADLDGDTLTYAWSEGGAALSNQASPTVSLAPGLHTIDLAVSDGKGGSASGSVVVDVKKALTGLSFVAPLPQFTVGVPVSVSARLSDVLDAPIAGATLSFTLTGSSLNGTTDANGIAAVTLTPGNNGVQELAVGYGGDNCREAVTFRTNVTVALPTATITVQKIVVNDDGGQLAAPAFSISVSSPNDTKTIAGNAAGVPVTVNAGVYSVVETLNADYDASYSADCSGTIAANATKACVITNNDRPTTLTLNKQIVNNNGGARVASDWVLTANGQGFTQGLATKVPPGTFVLAESGPSGYDPSAWNCGNAQLNGSTVTVPPHRDVVCTITNDDRQATLTLTKIVANDNGGTATAASWQLSAGNTSFATGTSQPINAGTYALAETGGPAGYAPTGWTCTGGTLQSGNQLTLLPGEIASCSITNNDTPGTLNVVVQVVTNSGGPPAVPSDVTVTVNGSAPSPASFAGSAAGTSVTLNAGGYSVGSSPLTGYTATPSADCAGTMTLAGTKTCTVIFDDNPPPQQRPPVANNQSVQTDEDTALQIQLTGSDPDGDPLAYILVAGPTSGVLTGTGAARVYTPNANVTGADSFTFKVNDGFADSNVATISISVLPVNDPPTANPQTLTTTVNTPVSTTLTGTDIDTATLSFAIATQPQHGTLQLTGASLTYSPAANYDGPDGFTFTASDGTTTSAPAAVSITVSAAPNTAPVADAKTVETLVGTPVGITLTGNDANGDPLTFAIVTPPSNGILGGTPPNMSYTPNPGYTGPDSFTYKANDGKADSTPATVTINVRPVNAELSVVLNDSPDPVKIGQQLQLLARVFNNGPDIVPNPTLTFTLPAGVSYTPAGPCTANATTVTCRPGQFGPGETPFSIVVVPQVAGQIITSVYTPDLGSADEPENTSTQSTFVQRADSATTLSSTPAPSTFGQVVTFTATVTGLNPTGNVSFVSDQGVIGAAPVVGGVATITTAALPTGARVIIASYAGDAMHDPSTSAPLTHTVQPVTSATGLVSSLNPSIVGQPVTFTATVSGATPTGTITFTIDGASQAPVAVDGNGTAILQTSALTEGSHVVAASYSGDVNNTSSVSNSVTQVVRRVTTATTLTSGPNPSTAGQTVTFTATVSGGTPTGVVTFQVVGGAQLGQAAVLNGVATLQTALGAGAVNVTATYTGDPAHIPSTSAAVSQEVGKAATSVTLVAQPNPAAPGTTVDLIATVTGASPEGSVTFMEGNQTLGVGSIDPATGIAILQISQGKKGNRQLSASYPGDANNLAGTSPRVRLTTK